MTSNVSKRFASPQKAVLIDPDRAGRTAGIEGARGEGSLVVSGRDLACLERIAESLDRIEAFLLASIT
jgi:hypothetical protein